MKYKWRDIHPGKGNAQAVGKEIEVLVKKYGHVTPRILVKEARRRSSAMHRLVEWDNTVAADAYREYQARLILCSLVTVVKCKGREPMEIRAFVNIGGERAKSGEYIMMSVAMSEPDTAAEVLAKAYSDMLTWKRRYGHLKLFADVVQIMESVPAPE